MKFNYWWLIGIGLIITAIGLLTKTYFFLLLLIPLTLFSKKKED
jgi:hypothetical protein